MARSSNSTEYGDQSLYNKHQCSCEDKTDCSCGPATPCNPGLVAIYDSQGHHVSCLTPEDAEVYNNSQEIPPTGYLKLYDPATCKFLGFVTPEDHAAAMAQLSDNIDPIQPVEEDQGFNVVTQPVVLNGTGLTAQSFNVDLEIDRINLDGPVVITLCPTGNPPPAGVTLNGSPVVMDEDESFKEVTLDVADTVAANTYNFDIRLVSGNYEKFLSVSLTLV